MKPKLLLFDLGGVLIEVDTAELHLLGGKNKSDIELWETWLTSPAVQLYESGKISDAEFARGVLEAFSSEIEPEAFLQSFTGWPLGFYPGMTDLLQKLRQTYKLAYLSNSNPLHYPRFQREWQLDGYFDFHFASYKMGHVKPHAEIFHAVLAALPYKAGEIFFVDDNRLNIEMARSLGMRAEIVRGPQELLAVLTSAEITG